MWFLGTSLWLLALAVDPVCLKDGIPPEKRHNLTMYLGTENEYNGPMLLYQMLWSSAKVANKIGRILLEEMFGYHTEEPLSGWNNWELKQALAGCRKGKTEADPLICNKYKPTAYAGFESWDGSGDEKIPKENWFEKVGQLDYFGIEGVYMQPAIADAFYKSGRIITHYKGWNADVYNDFSTHFTTFRQLLADVERDSKTNATVGPIGPKLSDIGTLPRVVDQYVSGKYDKFTGDSSTDPSCYNITTKKLSLVKKGCGEAWVAPKMRADPLSCIPMISSGDWGYFLVPQAAKFKWPVCYMTVGWSSYVNAGHQFKALIYWWTPDVTFKNANIIPMQIPLKDGLAQSNGDRTTTIRSALEIIAWQFLREANGGRGQFITKFQWKIRWYDSDADMWMARAALGMKDRDVACLWLKQEEKRWRKWIPDQEPPCPLGSEMDTATEACAVCKPGSYSSEENRQRIIWNCMTCEKGTAQPNSNSTKCDQCKAGEFASESGATQCLTCGKGYFQRSVAQSACSKCPPGSFSVKTGQPDCTTCDQGLYQEGEAQTECLACPKTFTTEWTGSTDGNKCICATGQFWNRRDDRCDGCQLQGVCDEVGLGAPTVWKGHYGVYDGTVDSQQIDKKLAGGYVGDTNAFSKLSIYACRSGQCDPQKGKPDGCFFNREAIACAICPEGKFGFECGGCKEGGAIYVLGVLIVLCPFVTWGGCVVTSKPYAAKATAAFQMASTFGIMAIFVQMLGMMGGFNIDWGWFRSMFAFAELFLLDLEVLGLGCVVGNSFTAQFYASFLLPVLVGLVLLLDLPISRVVPSIAGKEVRLTVNGCLNFMGMVYSALYISLVKLVVAFFECVPNPAAGDTLAKYKQVVCQSPEHKTGTAAMVIGMIVYVVGFFGLCLYLNFIAPSSFQNPVFRARCKFLVNRWRVDTWYWGSVAMARNLLLAFIAVISSTAVDQFIMMGIILMIFIVSGFAYMPWKDPRLAHFDNAICMCVFFAISCGIGFMHLNFQKKSYDRDTSETALQAVKEIDSRIDVFRMLLMATLAVVFLLFASLVVYCIRAMKYMAKLEAQEHARHELLAGRFNEFFDLDGNDVKPHFLRYITTGTHYDVVNIKGFLDDMDARIGMDKGPDSSGGSTSRKSKRLRLSVDGSEAPDSSKKKHVVVKPLSSQPHDADTL